MLAGSVDSGADLWGSFAGAGVSQSRGSSCTATSTPASSHQVNALRASAMPIKSISPPTLPSSPAIDGRVKELAGQTSRIVFPPRRDVEGGVSAGKRGSGMQRESMQYDVVI